MLLAGTAHAAAPGQPYRTDHFGGFRDVLPPGTNGLANASGIAAFLSSGKRPEHSDDQLAMYRDLMYDAPGLDAAGLARHYKDSSFGVPPGDDARTYSPGGRDDVTVIRDKSFGVPHVYATTRAGAMFALGYVTAEDRLFFIDVLRHLGRAQLTSFAGGAPGNRAFDEMQWANAPYTEKDLTDQIQIGLKAYGALGAQVQADAENYLAGLNAYIAEAKLDPNKMPGEYPAIGQPQGPTNFTQADIIATASLVGGIFGKGGGRELTEMQLLQGFNDKFGKRRGRRLWREWAAFEDPDAPTTIRRKVFHYQRSVRHPPRDAEALADPGTFKPVDIVESGTSLHATRVAPGHPLPGLLPQSLLTMKNSNALIVGADHSPS